MDKRPAMRRSERGLTNEEAISIISHAEYGVLSTCGTHGPYGVPINHVYTDGHIYMHCATEGHKLDNIAHDSRVCFTVVEQGAQINAQKLTTRYRSAIAFGTARILAGADAREPMLALCRALAPDSVDEAARLFDAGSPVRIIDLTVEQICGKGAPGA